jgi:hypothetical protein
VEFVWNQYHRSICILRSHLYDRTMKQALSFLGGAVLVSGAVVYAGGTGARMFVAGAIVAVAGVLAATLATGLNRAGTFLLALAGALERAETAALNENKKPIGFVPAPASEMTAQIKSALVNMGTKPKQAAAIAAEVNAQGGSFETMLRSAINMASGRAL